VNTIKDVKIRNAKPSDHENVISVMLAWWGGRDLSSLALKVFFIHFSNTSYVAEIGDDLVGFLVGFLSQSEQNTGYIHLVGVHPNYREVGLGRLLYEKYYEACRSNNRSIVKSCTSPINKLSIKFHSAMGFLIEPGDGMIDGVPVTMDFLRKDDPKVLFRKELY
jgi:GNAT superfamily N-acetyltransferase